MENSWIYIATLAIISQVLRGAVSKTLALELSPQIIALSRSLFQIPFLLAFLAVAARFNVVAGIPADYFLFYTTGIALLQSSTTVLLVYLLTLRSFFTTVVFTKSEVLYTALFGTYFFGKHLTNWGWVAIFLSLLGVILSSTKKAGAGNNKATSLAVPLDAGSLIGLTFGAISALTALLVPQATLAVTGGAVLANSLLVLVAVSIIQVAILFAYALLFKFDEVRRIFAGEDSFRLALLLGFLSAINSGAIYFAINLVNPALLKAFMNLEIVPALLISAIYFRERPSGRELLGVSLIMVAVLFFTLL